jgi:hypothetical protein
MMVELGNTYFNARMKIKALPSVELQGCAIKKLENKQFKE